MIFNIRALKICRENSRLIKIWQEYQVLYMKTGTCTFMGISRRILLRMRNVSDKSCRENQKKLCFSATVFRKSCRFWENEEKCRAARQATDCNTIWRVRFACWITKTTDTHTHRIRNFYCFTTVKMVMRTRLNVTFIFILPVLLDVKPGDFRTMKHICSWPFAQKPVNIPKLSSWI